MLNSRRSFLYSLAATGMFAGLQQQPPTPIRPKNEPLPAHPEPGEKLAKLFRNHAKAQEERKNGAPERGAIFRWTESGV
jgi:hypothetical protein